MDANQLRGYYGSRQFEYGFASRCRMVLPADQLAGRRVLDVCCRRGRGAYRLSELAGDAGSVLGVDWSPAYVEEARAGADRAWRKGGLSRSNLEFRVAYPEDLAAAGVEDASMDVAYVNSVVTLFCDPAVALAEIGRVLRPGGLLILETVLADRPRDEDVIRAARELGNSVQAARPEADVLAWLRAAGFGAPQLVEEAPVEADQGYRAGSSVPVAPGDEDVRYRAVALNVYKK